MGPELFNYILSKQKEWGEIFKKQDRQRRLEINRGQKMRARVYRAKKKAEAGEF